MKSAFILYFLYSQKFNTVILKTHPVHLTALPFRICPKNRMLGYRTALALSISHESLGQANNSGDADPKSTCLFFRFPGCCQEGGLPCCASAVLVWCGSIGTFQPRHVDRRTPRIQYDPRYDERMRQSYFCHSCLHILEQHNSSVENPNTIGEFRSICTKKKRKRISPILQGACHQSREIRALTASIIPIDFSSAGSIDDRAASDSLGGAGLFPASLAAASMEA